MQDHRHFSEIDSTNTYLKEHYQQLPHFSIVSADRQIAGHGRMGRHWDSEANKNLLFSLLIREPAYFRKPAALSLISALAIAQTLEEEGIAVQIKWPNDLWSDNRKLCGILLEAISQPELKCLIIGIGLNVNQQQFCCDYPYPPISLAQLSGREYHRQQLLEKLAKHLKEILEQFVQGADFHEELQKRLLWRNQKVKAWINHIQQTVKIIGIDEDCSLKVEDEHHQLLQLQSGEISFFEE